MIPIDPRIFKTYDVRGVVDRDFDEDGFHRIGRAFGSYLRRRGVDRAVVGRDVRPHSPGLTARFQEGLLASGVDVTNIGVCTSPQFYFALKEFGAGGGGVVTASHNPTEYNGIKLRCNGPVFGDALQVLRGIVDAGEFPEGKGTLEEHEGILERYLQEAAARVSLGRPLRVVLDGGNGTAGPAAVGLFRALGCEVHDLFCEPDGTFPNHHPNPLVPANLEDVRREVVAKGADLGFAYDGDGDRMTLVDETGTIRWTDRALAVTARALLREYPGRAIVFDVKASQVVTDVVKAAGGRPVMVKTGYPFLLAAMAKEKGLVGAELSGHMYYDDPVFDFDDGVYASARVAAVLSRREGPVSAAFEDLPAYVSSTEIRVRCPDERKFDISLELADWFGKEHEVITIDGARVLFEDGWGLVRASNTEPDLVLVFEGRDREALDRIRGRFRDALARFPEVEAGEL